MKKPSCRNEKGKSVSVIIVTHDQSDILRLQLLSLEKQKMGIRFEVIVSDDGSSPYHANRALVLIRNSALDILYTYQRHLGFRAARARNHGIGLARGEILLFLDGDMIPDPYLIQKHFNIHSQTGNINLIVAGNRLRRPWHLIAPQMRIEELLSLMKSYQITDERLLKRQKKEEQRRKAFLSSNHPWRCCFSCNLSIPNNPEVFFDERFIGWGSEDWQMVFRLISKEGYTAYYNSRLIAYEIETKSGGSNIFRGGGHNEIVQYLRNLFQFADECQVLSTEELFWGLRKIRLNTTQNTWELIKGANKESSGNLDLLIEQTRKWLIKQGIYP